MPLCPRCNSLLLINKNTNRDERLCPKCDFKGVIFIKDGNKFGICDKLNFGESELIERKV